MTSDRSKGTPARPMTLFEANAVAGPIHFTFEFSAALSTPQPKSVELLNKLVSTLHEAAE